MTHRIYYTDPMCRAFAATVVDASERDGRPAVVLDRTAFYPTSGGQPFDTGTIGACRVVDVIDDDEAVVHILDAPVASGTAVDCVIDWDRRFDHMQQHTGQHILSAAFERLLDNPTVSFHLGTDTCTIDLAREMTASDVARAETEANRIVWADESIGIRFVSADEARRLPLRKEPARGGTLRLIEISGFDLSACGGTHVSRTGAVGLIAVVGTERFKGASRVSFVCGERALRSHRLLRTAVADSIRVLSVAPAELPLAIERLQAESREQRKSIRDLREGLAVHEAQALLDGAPQVGGVRIVVQALEGYDPAALKSMALAMTSAAPAAVALFTTSTPAQVVIARSGGVPLDATSLLRELFGRYGGKGGGKPELAQGGGLTGDLRQIVWTASGLVEEACGGK